MIRLRRAEPNDIPEIIGIRGDSPSRYEDYLRDEMQSRNSLLLVGTDGNRVVGYCWAQITDDISVYGRNRHGSVAEMEVEPICRRQGIGTRLFEEVKRWLDSNGISRVEVRVHFNNSGGHEFWKKQGLKDCVRIMHIDVRQGSN